MPRKRTRTSSQIEETQSKFHFVEAKVRYESTYKNQQMHPEKGFTLKSNYRDFMALIHQIAEAINWELFCEKRPSVDEELVREFYTNLTSSKMTDVPVRGIKVPINSNAINEFFELPDFKNDEYSSLMRNIKLELLQEILEEVSVEESEEPEEPDEEENPTMQSFEVPDKVYPVEPKDESDAETPMFRAQ
ncbi:hypothetical protein PVK06_024804 [Gossypium arboreum]|uniref:Putative plant transposon protein domain-containing protein n=1 Tax=Gossypium arboreum TaxID=29729 RepID=A0ABR0PEX7_GOSAR|nr:hypothetical protein PVK06_024804 [Gossypium arboreum]